ncbi:MAG: hypothetical protein HY344_02390 [Candidatus Levybacteria bacterium]|nr:hypothetical protein [Candidatus Levybacteria bacterium]
MDEETKKIINVSKLDVAKRELEHAIKLFFNYGDFVIIHLSACAAEEILSGIGKASGIKSFKSQMDGYIKPEKQAFVLKKLNEPYNFFKHANSDPDKLLRFNPASSEFVIWDDIRMYQELTIEITGFMTAFRLWFYLKHKDILIAQTKEQLESFKEMSKDIDLNDRASFLEAANKLESQRTIGVKQE